MNETVKHVAAVGLATGLVYAGYFLAGAALGPFAPAAAAVISAALHYLHTKYAADPVVPPPEVKS